MSDERGGGDCCSDVVIPWKRSTRENSVSGSSSFGWVRAEGKGSEIVIQDPNIILYEKKIIIIVRVKKYSIINFLIIENT